VTSLVYVYTSCSFKGQYIDLVDEYPNQLCLVLTLFCKGACIEGVDLREQRLEWKISCV
jgi:hypothetical protein